MKKFEIEGIEYICTSATAIAECDNGNEACRQNVIVVDAFCDGINTMSHIVFGYDMDMPETVDEFNEMCEDYGAWEIMTDENAVIFTE